MSTTSRDIASLVGSWATTTATGREIVQQPDVWRRVAADLSAHRVVVDGFLAPLLATDGLRIVLTGAGTSAFAGQLLAPALARRLARRVEAVATTDIVSNPAEVFAEDVPTLLVSFGRSGDSPESIAATALADRFLRSAHHLIVTCNADGGLARQHRDAERSLVLLMPPESNDQGFAMTSSFTAMVLAAWSALVPDAGAPDLVDRLAAAGRAVLRDRATATAALVERGFRRIVFLGSGPMAALARESALKILELTAGAVVSYHDSSLGFRHGPKSVLDGETLTIVYLSSDPYTRRYDEDIAGELQRRGGTASVVVVAGRPSERLATQDVWVVPGVADVPDVLVSLPFVLVAQMLALQSSLAHGLTPDNPFPAGEVNRVVEGVTVHPYEAGR